MSKSRLGTRLRAPVALQRPTLRDLSWAAGFLEGEGSFFKSNKSEYVQADQVQQEPLLRLKILFGGTIRDPVSYSPAFRWSISGPRARGVMLTLFTMLSPRRKEQIKRALRTVPLTEPAHVTA